MAWKFNVFTGKLDLTGTGTAGADEKVKYDSGDPTAGYVADKFAAGTGITLAEGTGGDENKLKITSSITQYTDEMAQDAVGNAVGTGLSYNDTSGAISVAGLATASGLTTSTTAVVLGRKSASGGAVEELAIDTDLSSVSASDDTVPSAKATKAMGDLKLPLAGGTMSGNITFASYKAITMCCDNGTSFPGSPNTGQWFYRTDVKCLYIYESTWKPIISYGDMTLYVDGASGSDAAGKGFASGSSACATIQYAINLIPAISGGNVTVNIASGTYTEGITVQGKGFSGNYTITFNGTMTTSVASTTNDITQSTTILKRTTCGDKDASWTTNAYRGMLVELKDSGGTTKGIRVIVSNTATTLTIAGYWTSDAAATDTFIIYDFGTIISQTDNTKDTVGVFDYQGGLVFNYLKISNTGASRGCARLNGNTKTDWNYCHFSAVGSLFNILTALKDNLYFDYCYFYCTTSGRYNVGVLAQSYCLNVGGSAFLSETNALAQNIIVSQGSFGQFQARPYILNITSKATYGIKMTQGAMVGLVTSATDYIQPVVDNCTTGVYYEINSFSAQTKYGTQVTYTNCTTSVSVLASSNCYVDTT